MSVSLYGSGNTVIQVVNSTITSTFSTTSSTPVATGVTATITPQSSTSKILVIANLGGFYINTSSALGEGTIYRGSTNLAGSTNALTTIYSNAGNIVSNGSISYLDSPSTTSATTYSIYLFTSSGTIALGNTSVPTILTLLEISGS